MDAGIIIVLFDLSVTAIMLVIYVVCIHIVAIGSMLTLGWTGMVLTRRRQCRVPIPVKTRPVMIICFNAAESEKPYE